MKDVTIQIRDRSKTATCTETVALCAAYRVHVEPTVEGTGYLVVHGRTKLPTKWPYHPDAGAWAPPAPGDKTVLAYAELTDGVGTLELNGAELVRVLTKTTPLGGTASVPFSIYLPWEEEVEESGVTRAAAATQTVTHYNMAGTGMMSVLVCEPYATLNADQQETIVGLFGGEKGDRGSDGQNASIDISTSYDPTSKKTTVTLTPFTGSVPGTPRSFDVSDGQDGTDGQDGSDGANGMTPKVTASATLSPTEVSAFDEHGAYIEGGSASVTVTPTNIVENGVVVGKNFAFDFQLPLDEFWMNISPWFSRVYALEERVGFEGEAGQEPSGMYASVKDIEDTLDSWESWIDGIEAAVRDIEQNLGTAGQSGYNFKTKQTAVSDPAATGNATEFIASITQDANGVITAVKKSLAIDSTPTASSPNLVTSGGVKAALDAKADKTELPTVTAGSWRVPPSKFPMKFTVSSGGEDVEVGMFEASDMTLRAAVGDYDYILEVKAESAAEHYENAGLSAPAGAVPVVGFNALEELETGAIVSYEAGSPLVDNLECGEDGDEVITGLERVPASVSIEGVDVVTAEQLHKVAKSGSYNDLKDKPTIPDISGKADADAIAPEFDSSETYYQYDLVMREGKMFRCKVAEFSGEFSPSGFEPWDIADEIYDLWGELQEKADNATVTALSQSKADNTTVAALNQSKADRAPASPLCFTATEANTTVTLVKVGSFTLDLSLEGSGDGVLWSDYTVGTPVTLTAVGHSYYFRAKTTNARICPDKSGANYHCFQIAGKASASGDLTSLLGPYADPPDALPQRCFNCLFINCTGLVKAPNLPATKLGPRCYQSLFNGCTGLTEAPHLPATTLSFNCYANMFLNASNVAKVSVAFTMWSGDTPSWLSGVAASGVFICPDGLRRTYGVDNIPTGWSVNPAETQAAGVQPEVIAEDYDEVADYTEGDVVMHDGKRWYCIAMETTSGPWDQTQWEEQPVETALDNMRGDIAARLELDNAAPQFSAYVAYAVGDIVRYGGRFYVCTAAHSAGAWNAQHFAISSSRLPGVVKPKQTAVSDPMAAGESGQFIASISQNANGVISAQKRSIPYGKNNAAGTVWLSDATNSSTAAAGGFTAATPLAVKTVADSVGYTATAQVEGGNALADYIPDRTITTVTPETSDFDSHWGFTAAARSGNRLRDFYLYVEMGATYEPTTFHLDSGLVRYPYANPAATPTLQPGHCYLIHFREVSADIFTCTVDDLV